MWYFIIIPQCEDMLEIVYAYHICIVYWTQLDSLCPIYCTEPKLLRIWNFWCVISKNWTTAHWLLNPSWSPWENIQIVLQLAEWLLNRWKNDSWPLQVGLMHQVGVTATQTGAISHIYLIVLRYPTSTQVNIWAYGIEHKRFPLTVASKKINYANIFLIIFFTLFKSF